MRVFLFNILFLFTAGIYTSSSFASESHYLINQQATKNGSLEIDYRHRQETLNERGHFTKNGSVMDLNYSQPLTEATGIHFGAQFVNSEVSSSDNGQTHNVTGFGDFSLGIKSGTTFEPLTLVYGANATLSPGPAQNPYTRPDTSKAVGNNFSGTQSLSPYIGVESYVNQIAIGGKFLSNFFSQQQVEDNGDSRANGTGTAASYHFEGFVEFPVFKKVDVGVVMGMGRKDIDLSRYFESGNEYIGQIYSQYKFDKDTAVLASLSSQVVKVPSEKSSTDLTIGLRRSL